jgi:uncharacterized protein
MSRCIDLDRRSPSKQPQSKTAGSQQWRDLLFLHWSVPIEEIRAQVPAGMQLDLFDGKAYVGIVPFVMQNILPTYIPSFLAQNFLEINLRTYVHVHGEPGIYFFSLDANSQLAVMGARLTFSLPYTYADIAIEKYEEQLIYYNSKRYFHENAKFSCRYQVKEKLPASEEGSSDHFFLERYWLFLEKNKKLYKAQVHHTPYPAHRVEMHAIEESLIQAANMSRLTTVPEYMHYSPGVDVQMYPLTLCSK